MTEYNIGDFVDLYTKTDDDLELTEKKCEIMKKIQERDGSFTYALQTSNGLKYDITNDLIELLGRSRLMVVTVLHSNHANEIDELLTQQLKKLNTVSTLLNQAVLLKDVNDSFVVLAQLSRRLFSANVLPYYLHQLDPIQGTHHFYVKPEKGKALMQQLVNNLPGYLVPKYVEELAAAKSKVVVS